MRKRPLLKSEEEDVLQESRNGTNSKKSYRNFSKVKLTLFVLLILYIIIPLSIYLSPSVRRRIVFQNYIRLSRATNLSLPSESGLKCARNFFITSEDGIKLGAWHIPPKSLQAKCRDGTITPDVEFSDQKPVFLYLHGTVGDRAAPPRVSLYKILSEDVDAHVISYDYRGYGDSSNLTPSEAGLAQDTETVFNWISKRVKPSKIFVWGHSLGTGVGAAFMEKITESSFKPAALILEAPFTKIIEAVKQHPLSVLYRYMPFFDVLVARPIDSEETGFNTLARVNYITCPLLILHAEDDGIAPYGHGEIIYKKALASREKSPFHVTKFVDFEAKLKLGHNKIYENPDLPNVIKDFINSVLQL